MGDAASCCRQQFSHSGWIVRIKRKAMNPTDRTLTSEEVWLAGFEPDRRKIDPVTFHVVFLPFIWKKPFQLHMWNEGAHCFVKHSLRRVSLGPLTAWRVFSRIDRQYFWRGGWFFPSAELGLWPSVAALSDGPGLRHDGCCVGDVCSNTGAIECSRSLAGGDALGGDNWRPGPRPNLDERLSLKASR